MATRFVSVETGIAGWCAAAGNEIAPGAANAQGRPPRPNPRPAIPASKASILIDTRVVHCGDNLEQLSKLPDACVDLIYIDPLFYARLI